MGREPMESEECAFGHAAENDHCPGITKRQWFAGMALQGILANTALTEAYQTEKHTTDTKRIVIAAFATADMMLAHPTDGRAG